MHYFIDNPPIFIDFVMTITLLEPTLYLKPGTSKFVTKVPISVQRSQPYIFVRRKLQDLVILLTNDDQEWRLKHGSMGTIHIAYQTAN